MPKLLPAAAALAAALILAGVAAADQIRAVPRLPAGWSHAEINVIVKGTPHTLVYDRGRVLAVSATSLTLREQDGSVQTINVSAVLAGDDRRSTRLAVADPPARDRDHAADRRRGRDARHRQDPTGRRGGDRPRAESAAAPVSRAGLRRAARAAATFALAIVGGYLAAKAWIETS